MDNISIEVVQSIDRLEQLGQDWERVLERSGSNYPFLTQEWLLPWWKHMAPDKSTLYVLRAFRENDTYGYVPLLLARRNGVRILQFLGCPDSDYLDFIICRNRKETLEAFLRFLGEQKNSWDLIDLKDIPSDSPNLDLLKSRGKETGSLCVADHVRTVAPTLKTNGDFESFLKNKSHSFRQSFRQTRRRINKVEGTHSIDLLSSGNAWDKVVDSMRSVEKRSWKEKTGHTKLSASKNRKFFSNIMEAFARRGWLNLWTLSVNQQAVAYSLNFNYSGKCYNYFLIHDDDYEKFSPGALLFGYGVENAHNDGSTEFDCLRGDEPYKSRWTNDSRDCHQLVFHKTSLRSLLLFLLLRKLRWALKRSKTILRLKIWLVVKQRKMRGRFSVLFGGKED